MSRLGLAKRLCHRRCDSRARCFAVLTAQRRFLAAFETQAILDARQHLPGSVLRAERNNRQHLSSVLARNEVAHNYAYNRQLLLRVEQGWYQFNPQLSVRRRVGVEGGEGGEVETWVPVF